MKKKLSLVLIAVLLFATVFTVSGCVNPDAENYANDKGITMMLSSDGEDYYAYFVIVTDKEVDGLWAADQYLFDVLSTEFIVEKVNDTPKNENGNTIFAYEAKLTEDQWFLNGDVPVSYGFLNLTVNYDFENPFASCYVQGTPFNRIYQILKNGNDTFESADYYFLELDLDVVNTKLLITTKNTTKTENGSVIYDSANAMYFYQMTGILSQTAVTGSACNRIVYSYTVMASYGWFTIAILLGLIVAVAILLLSKKKEGKTINLEAKPNGYNDYGSNPFGGNNYNRPDPFNSDKPSDASVENSDGNGDNSNENGGNGGNVFNGF